MSYREIGLVPGAMRQTGCQEVAEGVLLEKGKGAHGKRGYQGRGMWNDENKDPTNSIEADRRLHGLERGVRSHQDKYNENGKNKFNGVTQSFLRRECRKLHL
jgi:hypothetical protein